MTHPTAPADAPYPHPAALPDDLLLRECTWGQGRASGPGGQHRNKVETKVIITHDATGLVGQAGERREMTLNRKLAFRRLRLLLAVHHRAPVPIGEIGSPLWHSRLHPRRTAEGRTMNDLKCNPEHDDYPALLAEALDTIADAKYELRPAALRLRTSASQLLKLIRHHPPALAMINDARAQRGKHRLK